MNRRKLLKWIAGSILGTPTLMSQTIPNLSFEENSPYHSIVAWAESTLFITKSGSKSPLVLAKHQKIILTQWMTNSRNIHVKARRSGGTIMGLIVALYSAATQGDSSILYICNDKVTSNLLHDAAMELMPFSGLTNKDKTDILYPNNSWIRFMSLSERVEPVARDTYSTIIFDEMDYMLDDELDAFYFAINNKINANHRSVYMSSFSSIKKSRFKKMLSLDALNKTMTSIYSIDFSHPSFTDLKLLKDVHSLANWRKDFECVI